MHEKEQPRHVTIASCCFCIISHIIVGTVSTDLILAEPKDLSIQTVAAFELFGYIKIG